MTAAARRFQQTSDELAESVIVRGKATPLQEEPVKPTSDDVPASLYERMFELTDIAVIRGNSEPFDSERTLTFKGYTRRSPTQRVDDSRNPTLDLDGQAFFDRTSGRPTDAVLFVGGPEIAPIMGFVGRTASVVDGPLKGSPVRAFLAEGADTTLPESLPLLVGFHGQPTLASAEAATQAQHVVVALDALRQAARLGAADQVDVTRAMAIASIGTDQCQDRRH